MNIIKCNALNCVYNSNLTCIKIHVTIEAHEFNALNGSSYPICSSVSDIVDLEIKE
jgi:hypothetical protein